MVSFKRFFLLISVIVISACSTGGKNERYSLRSFFLAGRFNEGIEFLNTNKFYQDKNEILLKKLELAMFYRASNKLDESIKEFEEAKRIINEQFTISASKKATKAVLNDNYDIFYGEYFERSHVYFYQSLNYLLKYQESKNRDDLFKARAEILAWDSYLKTLETERLGQSVYKKDLLLKIFGAYVHDRVDTREDLQIANNLILEAEDVLFKNYNTYKTFNKKFDLFKKDFEILPNKKIDEIKKNYVEKTEFTNQLEELLKERKKKPVDIKDKTKITVILENGIIAQKVAKEHYYSLEGLAKEPLIAFFVADVLGMLPPPNNYSPGGVYSSIQIARASMLLAAIGFELPSISENFEAQTQVVEVMNQTGTKVLDRKAILINPLGDIAEEAISENANVLYTRTGARLAVKHMTAILASFATYKSLGGGNKEENFLAKNAAILQYAAASRVIMESERADTRYWSTLPNEIRVVTFELPKGKYQLKLKKSETEIKTFDFEVFENQKDFLLNWRI